MGHGSSFTIPVGGTTLYAQWTENLIAGGTVTLTKLTNLIGNYPEKVSGTGWAVHGDTTVTLNQCASTAYSAATCDAANQVTCDPRNRHARRYLHEFCDSPGRGCDRHQR